MGRRSSPRKPITAVRPARSPACRGIGALATGQPALQTPEHPRVLGPDRPLLAESEAVRTDDADDFAVLRDQLPVQGGWRVHVGSGALAAAAGRRSVGRSVGAESSPARLSPIDAADHEVAVAGLSAHATVRSTASRSGPPRRPW